MKSKTKKALALLLCLGAFAQVNGQGSSYCASCHWYLDYAYCAPDTHWGTEDTHCTIDQREVNGIIVTICVERFSITCMFGEWPPPY